jgi:hypothetical protein
LDGFDTSLDYIQGENAGYAPLATEQGGQKTLKFLLVL